MKTFITEYVRDDGFLYAGGRFWAADWADAVSLADPLGLRIVGELIEKIPAGDVRDESFVGMAAQSVQA